MYDPPATTRLLAVMEPQAAENEVATRGVNYQAARETHAGRYTSGRLVTIVVTM
jgi:hypothetical protein